MAVAPEEIAEKEFTLGLRGYDKDEVRSYLQIVATDLREAIAAASTAATEGRADADSTTEAVDTSAKNGSATEGGGSTKAADKATSSARGDAAATIPGPADGATPDWSNLGEEIASVLRTAHEQANGLRSDAESQAASIRQGAQQEADASREAAEKDRADAASALEKAQSEALDLVAEAQSRIDDRLAKATEAANREAEASVAGLTAQIGELTTARDEVRAELTTLRARLDDTLAATADETVSAS